MQPCLTGEQMRSADHHTIKQVGIPELVLMEQAALAVLHSLERRFGASLPAMRGLILAGPGNNGGDAIALARMLGTGFSLVFFGSPTQCGPSVKTQLAIAHKLGIKCLKDIPTLSGFDWVVDGLFGTGLKRPLEGKIKTAVEKVNAVEKIWRVAIDIPSGLDADTGKALGVSFRAEETVTLGFYKRGLVTGDGPEYAGRVVLSEIQIPRQISGIRPDVFLLERKEISRFLPIRRSTGNKGSYGHVFVWSGVPQKEGAAGLATLAAYRSGAGLVSLVAEKGEADSLKSRLPLEIMVSPESEELFSKTGTGVVGPGFGLDEIHGQRLKRILSSTWPLVVDGDALTLISEDPKLLQTLRKRKAPTILTPHPKEASRLLESTVTEVQADRFTAITEIVKRTGVTVVLKGRGTLISAPKQPIWVINRGNSSLSKGGTGDTLAGFLGSFLAQGCPAECAAALGVYVHGRAAEILTQKWGTERTLLASDLEQGLPDVFRELELSREK